jgi:hypothetical protein
MPAPKRHDSAYGRFYEPPGHPGLLLPSVTHILSCLSKPALVNWAAKQEREAVLEAAADLYCDLATTPPMSRMAYAATLESRLSKQKAHQRTLAKAAEIGSQVHALAEWTLRRQMGQVVGPEPKTTTEGIVAFTQWQDWAASVKLEPVFLETPVWSLLHGYAGTLDVYGRVDGRLVVIDFKTSSAIYPEYDLQVAAYIAAMREMGQGDPDGGLIVRVPKKVGDVFEVRDVPNWTEKFEDFLAVRRMWAVWYAWEKAYQDSRHKG